MKRWHSGYHTGPWTRGPGSIFSPGKNLPFPASSFVSHSDFLKRGPPIEFPSLMTRRGKSEVKYLGGQFLQALDTGQDTKKEEPHVLYLQGELPLSKAMLHKSDHILYSLIHNTPVLVEQLVILHWRFRLLNATTHSPANGSGWPAIQLVYISSEPSSQTY